MYYNEKRKAITAKYVKTHLDDIKIRVPKGQREKLKAIASEMGMSMNQMFIKAVEEYIEKNYKPEAESETDWQIEICTEYFLKKLLTTKLLYSII